MNVLERAHVLGPVLREQALESEAARRLSPVTVEALRDAGMFRMFVPAVYGGDEVDPLTGLDAISALAEADGASGWCSMIASTTSSLASMLDPSWAEIVFGDNGSVSGGAFAPNGIGTSVDGGFNVTGRWAWGSGTDHCDWITGGTLTDTGQFHLMLFPRADVSFIDTWDTGGLRGTASNDFEVRDAFVPDGRSVQYLTSTPQVDSALARFPNFSLLSAGVAAAMLGIGRRAIDEVVALAATKVPMLASKRLAEWSMAQVDIARAEAALSSARAFLRDEVATAWDLVLAGDPVPVTQRARIRLACSHIGTEAVRAVDLAYNTAGGSAVYSSSPISRCFRDIHTASAHIMVSSRIYETFGKLHLGFEVDTSML